MTVDAAMEHPNKVPFKGVLCRVDEFSDKPPSNNGHMTKPMAIPKDVAKKALKSLEGMGVNVRYDYAGHDRQNKIGVIVNASIGGSDGKDVIVEGHLYGKDFPNEVQFIQLNKEYLGMSYEMDAFWEDILASALVAEDVVYTGATIMWKDLAAYSRTSVAAQAQMKEELEMTLTPEQAKALDDTSKAVVELTKTVGTLATTVAAQGQALEGLAKPAAPATVETPAATQVQAQGNDLAAAITAGFKEGFTALAAVLKPAEPAAATQVQAQAAAATQTEEQKQAQAAVDKTQQSTVDAAAAGAKAPERKSMTVEAQAFIRKYGDASEGEGATMSRSKLDKILADANVPSAERFNIKRDIKKTGITLV